MTFIDFVILSIAVVLVGVFIYYKVRKAKGKGCDGCCSSCDKCGGCNKGCTLNDSDNGSKK
ncbi:MAG: hypothetical protein RR552_03915 [Oscillospiraceae bacterium]